MKQELSRSYYDHHPAWEKTGRITRKPARGLKSHSKVLLITFLFILNLTWILPAETFPQQADSGIAHTTSPRVISILRLEDAEKTALKSRAKIKEALLKKQAAIEEEKGAAAELFPRFSAGYTYVHFKETPYALFSLVPGAPKTKFYTWKEDRFSWNIQITQPVFTGFALTTRRKIAQLGIDIADSYYDLAVLDVMREVRTAFFKTLLAEKCLITAKEAQKQLEAHAKDAETFFEQGLIPKNDLLKSKVALAQAIQNHVKAKSDLEVAKAALNMAMGRDINEPVNLFPTEKQPDIKTDLAAITEAALARRPELAALETSLKQAGLGVKLARSASYPQVFLSATYEQEGDNIRATSNDFKNSYNLYLGASATWDFFDWGKTRAKVSGARYKKEALSKSLKEVTDAVSFEVKAAYNDYVVAKKNIETARKALDQAKENFRITNLQYKNHTTGSTEVIDAQTFLTTAQQNYYAALYGCWIAAASLDAASGGAVFSSKAQENRIGEKQ